jgi:hypothetical protein
MDWVIGPFYLRSCRPGLFGICLHLGTFAAEVSFLIAAVGCAVRLIRLRRDRAMWDAKAAPRDEPAASAQQELLARYRKKW